MPTKDGAAAQCSQLHIHSRCHYLYSYLLSCAGLGPIGLCAIRWCQIKGAKTVIAIDLVKDRLELARKTFPGVTLIDRNEVKNVAQKVCILTLHKPAVAARCWQWRCFAFAQC